jgi:hypothetical protein
VARGRIELPTRGFSVLMLYRDYASLSVAIGMALKALELLWRREPEAESVFEALYGRSVSNGFPGRLLRRAS